MEESPNLRHPSRSILAIKLPLGIQILVRLIQRPPKDVPIIPCVRPKLQYPRPTVSTKLSRQFHSAPIIRLVHLCLSFCDVQRREGYFDGDPILAAREFATILAVAERSSGFVGGGKIDFVPD